MYDFDAYLSPEPSASIPIGWIILAIIFVITVLKNLVIVPQTKVYIVERLGKYSRSWDAGVHLKIPFIERIAKKVSTKEVVLDFEPQRVITKDNVTMTIDSVVFMRVSDPKLYTYGVEDPVMAIESLSATTLRNLVGALDFDGTLTSRDTINANMERTLDEATDAWGIKVTRVEVKDIQPPRDIQEVMQKQMTAEREKRKAVLESQAHKESVVMRAEGDKRAAVLRAEAESEAAITKAKGKAESIRMIYQAEADGLKFLAEAGMNDAVLKLKSLEAMKAVADGNATKIFLPSDIAGVLTGAGAIGDALKSGFEQPKEKPADAAEPKQDACCEGPKKSIVTQILAATDK